MRSTFVKASALGTAAALLLAGCSSPAESADSLDVWIMQGTNPDSEAFFDTVATAFEEQTGAELNIEFVEWADAHDQFVNGIAGDETPDVAETGTTWTPEFADAGALVPLGPYVEEAGLGDDLVQGLVDAGTYEDELYGMPWYAGVRSLVYRADIFDELGLAAPTTWDDIVAAGNAIEAAHPEMMAFAVPGSAEFSAYPWIWGAGGEIATQDGDTWTSELESAASVEGMSFFTGLQTEHGFSSAGATTWNERDVLDAFSNGEVAMAVMGSWTPATLLEQNPDLDGAIAATPIPAQDGGIAPSVLGGSHLSMFQTAEDQDLAWEFIEMMTTGEFAEQWGSQSGYFPGQVSLLNAALESDDPLVSPFVTQFVDGGATPPVSPNFGAVQAEAVTPTAVQAILSGNATVDEAMSTAATDMTATLNGE